MVIYIFIDFNYVPIKFQPNYLEVGRLQSLYTEQTYLKSAFKKTIDIIKYLY